MKPVSCIAAVLAVVALAGCASTPSQTESAKANLACISGGPANLIRHFTENEAHVTVMPVDNRKSGPYGNHCMPGGKIVLSIGATHGTHIGAGELVRVTLKEAHNYEVRANLNSGKIRFRVVDVSAQPEVTIHKYQLEYGHSNSDGRVLELPVINS